jgi:hypothetical protein
VAGAVLRQVEEHHRALFQPAAVRAVGMHHITRGSRGFCQRCRSLSHPRGSWWQEERGPCDGVLVCW